MIENKINIEPLIYNCIYSKKIQPTANASADFGVIKEYLDHISNSEQRRIVDYFVLQFETNVLPILSHLRKSVIHNDANDYNIIVKKNADDTYEISGIIDFSDMVSTYTICELAITLAYTMLNKENPVESAADVIRGYHSAFPITEQELDILIYLICARLCTSVVMSAYRKKQNPENEYLKVSERPVWALLEKLISKNPIRIRDIFRQACGFQPIPRGLSKNDIIKSRQKTIGKSLSISYDKPLKIVRGVLQYLFDDEGNTYLDAVNNVPNVGHSHPSVVRAAQKQISILNTNTRYLHDYLVKYAQKLTATMPDPLSVCYFVCSGSEANDLALRMAQANTGQIDNVVIDGAYHGTTIANIEISSYKFDGPGGKGSAKHIHKVPMPDTYRGLYRSENRQTGEKYAEFVKQAIKNIQTGGKNINAFICESILGCGGQIVLPEDYLKHAYGHARKAGGVCIADEVQVGFGRVGTHMWAFETQDVVPDIVTLGKPIGNGHPLAAVVTTPEISEAFTTGMEYFNTYGGNPVSCAVGLAVLEIVKEEGLQKHALEVGNYLKDGLMELMSKHQIIGDVRGLGLFIGIELVRDRETLEPAAEEATQVIEQMKDRGILISTDGPLHNVLKIKPPLVFNEKNAKFLVETLDLILTEL